MSDEPNVIEPRGTPSSPAVRPQGEPGRAQAGARELGATLFELAPGGAVSPYHLHHANEELLIVLDGRPSLRTPAGTREFAQARSSRSRAGRRAPTRCATTAAGPRASCRSTMNFPDIAEHVDTGTTLAVVEPRTGRAFPKDGHSGVGGGQRSMG